MTEKHLPRPDLEKALDGRQFVMVVPIGTVSEIFATVQCRVSDFLPLTATYPVFPHITIGAYEDPARTGLLDRTVREWATHQPAIDVESMGIETFPEPFRVVYLRCRATETLAAAFTSLQARTKEVSCIPFGPLRSLKEHVFHMSLAYCDGTSPAEWEKIRKACRSLDVPHGKEVVGTVKFAVFSGGERTGTIALRGSPLSHPGSGLS
ncbi:MAG: 2'-5' RNA ligase family protein [Candidatus Dormibacteria bacterium]